MKNKRRRERKKDNSNYTFEVEVDVKNKNRIGPTRYAFILVEVKPNSNEILSYDASYCLENAFKVIR